MECKSWHNCRHRSYPRIPTTAYCHVPNWPPHLVPCSRSTGRPPTASTDHQPCNETLTFLSHYPGTQETTMARIQARPTTFHQTAGCAPIGRSVLAPQNPACGIFEVNRLHGGLPIHSRAQCSLICGYGMGDHPCRIPGH